MLIIDDRLSHTSQGAAALLDRLDEPLGAAYLTLDEFLFLFRRFRIHQTTSVVFADTKVRNVVIYKSNYVATILVRIVAALLASLDNNVRGDQRDEGLHERSARLGIKLVQLFADLLNRIDRVTGFLLNRIHPVLSQVIQVRADDHPKLVCHLGFVGKLAQQALAKVSSGDAGGFKRLNNAEGFLGFG